MQFTLEKHPGQSPVLSQEENRQFTDLNHHLYASDDENQIEENSLMELTLNLERERETYLEAVAVLHDQLRESHEHCRHLVDSHAELTKELELEADDGWKEARKWQEKYKESCRIIKAAGLSTDYMCNLSSISTNEYSLDETNGIDKHTMDTGTERYTGELKDGIWVYTLSDNFEDYDLENYRQKGGLNKQQNGWINLKSPRRFTSIVCSQHSRTRNAEPLDITLKLLSAIDF
ncbi:hypothetical protein BEWA_022080 [Theileria equi strain WA]|uniref:Uncharacterized protein n=1 Tax=Theileria equi strain WA TaxID=1537102 RepID=L0AUZ4_THEEQ|nr:hypothetical protein BEWA_022080 [Theileria equi strain WA]AFZ79360.1 hypothetical protein BEWA_022080 [Theileria equi strain WA]|eukprot:XP_004829026.1 hypothetical protein BEWA_022080 [Theileria equi strain WA]